MDGSIVNLDVITEGWLNFRLNGIDSNYHTHIGYETCHSEGKIIFHCGQNEETFDLDLATGVATNRKTASVTFFEEQELAVLRRHVNQWTDKNLVVTRCTSTCRRAWGCVEIIEHVAERIIERKKVRFTHRSPSFVAQDPGKNRLVGDQILQGEMPPPKMQKVIPSGERAVDAQEQVIFDWLQTSGLHEVQSCLFPSHDTVHASGYSRFQTFDSLHYKRPFIKRLLQINVWIPPGAFPWNLLHGVGILMHPGWQDVAFLITQRWLRKHAVVVCIHPIEYGPSIVAQLETEFQSLTAKKS